MNGPTRFKPCAIVPSHDHYRVTGEVVRRLRDAGLPVFLIDDGSGEPARGVLAARHDPEHGVVVHRLTRNQGKGGAVIEGFRLAEAAGFSHAVQVDADGQHDLAALASLLALGAEHPDAVIVGAPRFDGSMPLGRRIGRWITHVWVAIETLRPQIIDGLCGFRLYPLAEVAALLREERVCRGMDFDIDILVRLVWRGVEPIAVPVRVTYPEGNSSNFRMLRDNWRISRIHTVLVLTMLVRWPQILQRRAARQQAARRRATRHWAAMAERGGYWGLRLLAGLYRSAGRSGLMVPLTVVVFFFHWTGREQRLASRLFLSRAFAARGEARRITARDTLRHFQAFAAKVVDTFIGWLGGIDRDAMEFVDAPLLQEVVASGRGLLLIVSHLGNIDLSRALMDKARRDRITVLVHTRHAENYMRLLRRFRPEAAANTMQVTEVNPGTMIALQDAIDRGEWIAIAGDRTPVRGTDRVSVAPFLGQPAPFPQGPYVLAHLLGCPVYLMHCLREGGRYRLYFEKFADRVELPRAGRDLALAQHAARYAARLEAYCLKDPFQWFNFFDFWRTPTDAPDAASGTRERRVRELRTQ